MDNNITMKEIERQTMAQGDLPADKAAMPAQGALSGKGPTWYNWETNKINSRLLSAWIIDENGITRSGAGIHDQGGKRLSYPDLERLLREEIAKYFPEKDPRTAHNILSSMLDMIPSAAVETGIDEVSTYMTQRMAADIHTFQASAGKKTGFPLLDAAIGGLYPGLYVIAATTGLGKTTIVHQIADQLAAAGTHVLYFSLEMSRFEMVSKSFSRTMATIDRSRAVSSLAIRLGRGGDLAQQAIKTYAESIGNRLSIIEGNFNCTVPFIAEYIQNYIDRTGERPVIFIDYLQIMQPPAEMQRGQIRENVDLNITELKRLSRAFNIPVCVVSSISRTYYLSPISLECLKESGGIEYTADCVWGLQFSCMNDEVFKKKDSTWAQKDEVYKRAKNTTPREIDLVVLKSRFTGTDIIDHFNYFPAFDLFTETSIDAKDARTGFIIDKPTRRI